MKQKTDIDRIFWHIRIIWLVIFVISAFIGSSISYKPNLLDQGHWECIELTIKTDLPVDMKTLNSPSVKTKPINSSENIYTIPMGVLAECEDYGIINTITGELRYETYCSFNFKDFCKKQAWVKNET